MDTLVGATVGAVVGATLDVDDDDATEEVDDDTGAALLDDELTGAGAWVGATVGDAQPTAISAKITNNKTSLIERDMDSSSSIFTATSLSLQAMNA